jgi:DNA-directed RNA polymerase subunit RPC12/RpoP
MVIGDDGLVKSIIRPYRCSICGGDTSEIEYDYLVGYDHLGCVLKEESERPDNFDKCVICGKETPYLRSTHIDLREGYVEGGGQGCYQPNICGK